MDHYIDTIDGYINPETTFYRTDTDSIIIGNEQEEILKPWLLPCLMEGKTEEERKQMKINSLGLMDYDIKGKITQFREVCPKVYCCKYVEPDNSYGCHVRAKGFSKSAQKELTLKHYDAMLGISSCDEIIHLDSMNCSGKITVKGQKVRLDLDDKLKKIGLNRCNRSQERKGMQNMTIHSIGFHRTLNQNKWTKRRHIEGHPNMLSVAWGSTIL